MVRWCGVLVVVALCLLAPAAGLARVLNVEFKFTPFVGDPATAEVVTTVPGTARVTVNGIPVAETEVDEDTLPVLFEAREIAPAVWLPVESLGSILRQRGNTLHVEFTPRDAKQKYRAQLRWATVNDEVSETSDGAGSGTATNQAGEGVDDQAATGPLVMEQTFDAPFAVDRPWHHAPAETALSAADRVSLAGLVDARLAAFAPDYSRLYALLEGQSGLDLAAIKKLGCIAQAHDAGLRIAGPGPGQLDLVLSGHAEIVLQGKTGPLFRPDDPSVIEKIRDEEVQMCAGAALMRVFPPRLIVVRAARGGWQVVD